MTHRGPARAAARSLAPSPSSAPGAPPARHLPPAGRLLAAVALVTLIGAGCSNAPTETGSSGEEKPATQGSPSTEPDPNAPGETGDGGDQNAATEVGPIPRERTLEFAECMRENGVEDFPDPDDAGIIQYYGEPDPAEFTSAQENCSHLRPRPEGRNPGNGG
jgi:hypothetical protein